MSFLSRPFSRKSVLHLCGLLTSLFILRNVKGEQFHHLFSFISYSVCLFSVSVVATCTTSLYNQGFSCITVLIYVLLPYVSCFKDRIFKVKAEHGPRYRLLSHLWWHTIVYCILYLLFHYLVMSSVSQRDFQYDGREFWCVFRALNVVLKGVSWSALPDT